MSLIIRIYYNKSVTEYTLQTLQSIGRICIVSQVSLIIRIYCHASVTEYTLQTLHSRGRICIVSQVSLIIRIYCNGSVTEYTNFYIFYDTYLSWDFHYNIRHLLSSVYSETHGLEVYL